MSDPLMKAVSEMFGAMTDIATQSLAEVGNRVSELEAAIRKHRDYRGDDRCWMDDEELYKVLPEGYTVPIRDTAVELKNCERFIACRQNPATEYVSPEREIEELRAEVALSRQEGARAMDAVNRQIRVISMLRKELMDVKRFAEGHHRMEESCQWLHALTVDIPHMIEVAIAASQ